LRSQVSALAAVSLFSEKQPAAVSGNESRIPEMVDLLESYGDTTLAENYLTCGQPDLNAAARRWADRRGYKVGTGAGSHRATWGSGK